jgi:hypothetical protein
VATYRRPESVSHIRSSSPFSFTPASIAFNEDDFSARKYLFAVNGNLKAHANHITMDERIRLALLPKAGLRLAACRRNPALLKKAPLGPILAVITQGSAPLMGEKRFEIGEVLFTPTGC